MRLIKIIRMKYHDYMAQYVASFKELDSRDEFLYHLNKYIELRNEVEK